MLVLVAVRSSTFAKADATQLPLTISVGVHSGDRNRILRKSFFRVAEARDLSWTTALWPTPSQQFVGDIIQRPSGGLIAVLLTQQLRLGCDSLPDRELTGDSG